MKTDYTAATSDRAILLINPGSTSTKLAVSNSLGNIVLEETLRHSVADLRVFARLHDQFPRRLTLCRDWVKCNVSRCDSVVAIGGLFRPLEGGVYRINENMLKDAGENLQGEHASNLGCALAHEIAKEFGAPAYVVDPVSVDEFEPLAYYSGHPSITRKSLSHALSIHAAARNAAAVCRVETGSSSFVIGHLGGGISIAAVKNGKIIDVNDAASDGPFSPERTGGLPLQQFMTLATTEKLSEWELRSMVMGKGGLVAYLGTNSVEEVTERIRLGDEKAREVFHAMTYQIAKEIGAMATVLEGRVDAVVLTGGIAGSQLLVDLVRVRVKYIAPVLVFPGDDEMRSLAMAAAQVLRGEEKAKEY